MLKISTLKHLFEIRAHEIREKKLPLLKKISFGKNKRHTKCTLFSFPNSNSPVLLLIPNSY